MSIVEMLRLLFTVFFSLLFFLMVLGPAVALLLLIWSTELPKRTDVIGIYRRAADSDEWFRVEVNE